MKFKNCHLLQKWKIPELRILGWANKWRHRNRDNYIPEFISVRANEDADIIVDLNGKIPVVANYRMVGNFGEVFNLAIWQTG